MEVGQSNASQVTLGDVVLSIKLIWVEMEVVEICGDASGISDGSGHVELATSGAAGNIALKSASGGSAGVTRRTGARASEFSSNFGEVLLGKSDGSEEAGNGQTHFVEIKSNYKSGKFCGKTKLSKSV